MSGLSPARMAAVKGHGRKAEARDRDDYYPTPPWATQALLNVETFDGAIWECACGGGHMAEVLHGAGHKVIATDLVDRGHGEDAQDFLLTWQLRAPNVVTNPPYKLATEFAHHALSIGAEKVALLVALSFLEGQQRHREIFANLPPARVWIFPRRPRFAKGRIEDGSGLQAYCWCVWQRGHVGAPALGWLA